MKLWEIHQFSLGWNFLHSEFVIWADEVLIINKRFSPVFQQTFMFSLLFFQDAYSPESILSKEPMFSVFHDLLFSLIVRTSYPHVALCLERSIVTLVCTKSCLVLLVKFTSTDMKLGQELSTQTSRFKALSSCRLGSWLDPWIEGFKKWAGMSGYFQQIYLAGCYAFKIIVCLWYTNYMPYNMWISTVLTLPSGRSQAASITSYTNSSSQLLVQTKWG